MSDVENQEVETEVESNPIEDLINAIADQNFNRAEEHFNDLLGDRVNTALDIEKQNVADTIFNGVDEDQLELDLEDEESEDFEDQSEDEDN